NDLAAGSANATVPDDGAASQPGIKASTSTTKFARIVAIRERFEKHKVVGTIVAETDKTMKFQPRDQRLPAWTLPRRLPESFEKLMKTDPEDPGSRNAHDATSSRVLSLPKNVVPFCKTTGTSSTKKTAVPGKNSSKTARAQNHTTSKNRYEDADIESTLVGHVVVAGFENWKHDEFLPRGQFLYDLGRSNTPKAEQDAILAWYKMDPLPHSRECEEEALELTDDTKNHKPLTDVIPRVDLTNDLYVFSIDPTTAKDLDDAISVQIFDSLDDQAEWWEKVYKREG
ncbi:unnamed protein product, partial [Amoebophrya sp. A120]